MSSVTTVVKSSGKRQSEAYNHDKLWGSIEAACLSVNLSQGVASDTADHVTHAVEKWLDSKHEVTSSDIRRVATDHLTTVSPEAGYLYKHHHKIL